LATVCPPNRGERSTRMVRRNERMQQVLTVAGKMCEKFAVGVITDTGEGCLVTEFC